MENRACRAHRSAVSATNTPMPPDHFTFPLSHIQDKTRTDRNASLAPDAIFHDNNRWIGFVFFHSSTSFFQKGSVTKQASVNSNFFNHATFILLGQIDGPHRRKRGRNGLRAMGEGKHRVFEDLCLTISAPCITLVSVSQYPYTQLLTFDRPFQEQR